MHNFVEITERIGSPLLGGLLPALIFGLSVVLTLMLIRHFTRQNSNDNTESGSE
jgi:hypothetical protein